MPLLGKASDLAADRDRAQAYESHLRESKDHRRLIDERLQNRNASASKLGDLAMKAAALHWGAFFATQPDTPAKPPETELAARPGAGRLAARSGPARVMNALRASAARRLRLTAGEWTRDPARARSREGSRPGLPSRQPGV